MIIFNTYIIVATLESGSPLTGMVGISSLYVCHKSKLDKIFCIRASASCSALSMCRLLNCVFGRDMVSSLR